MNTGNLNSQLDELYSKLEDLEALVEDSKGNSYYAKICDIIDFELEDSVDSLQSLESEEESEESETILSELKSDISLFKIILDVLISAKEDHDLSPGSTKELISQLKNSDFRLTSAQEEALAELSDLESSDYSYMDENPASPPASSFEDDDDLDDDEFEAGLRRDELDEDFEKDLEKEESIAMTISKKYNVPINEVKEEIDYMLEDMDLDEVEEKLHEKYKYVMEEDDDTQPDQTTDREVSLDKLKTQDAPTQSSVLNKMVPDRLSHIPGVERFYKKPEVAEASLLEDLIKIADKLDQAGFHKEAEVVDIIITKVK